MRTAKVTTATTIAAQNTFSQPIKLGPGFLVFSVAGASTPDARIVVQRSVSSDALVAAGTAVWRVVGRWDSTLDFAVDNTMTQNGQEASQVAHYRWGILTGDYVSGSFTGEIRQ